MSVELCSKKGPVGQVATNQGYQDLIKFVNLHEADIGVELRALLLLGKTEGVRLAITEAEKLIDKTTDADVHATLENLIGLLRLCDGFAVIE